MKDSLIVAGSHAGMGVAGVAGVEGVNSMETGSPIFDIALKLLIAVSTAIPTLKSLYQTFRGIFKKKA